MTAKLDVEPLTAEAFSPFGSVIEISAKARQKPINEGWTTRFDALAQLDLAQGGVPLINIFRSKPKPFPIRIELMERHPLGCQTFYPLSGRPYLVVVAGDRVFDPAKLRAFRAESHQGVNYRRNVWHHYSLALEVESDFLVVDRGGPGDNLEEVRLDIPVELLL